MRLHRFFFKFQEDHFPERVSDKEIVRQVRTVLRLNKGDALVFFNGEGVEVRASIVGFSRGALLVAAEHYAKNKNEREPHVALFCSILKKEHFEIVAQKATEIGVQEIVPVRAERTVKLGISHERLERIIKEAAEQSGRGVLPVLSLPLTLEEALLRAKEYDANLFFHSQGDAFHKIMPVLAEKKRRSVWIGPEGGWSAEEVDIARSRGFYAVSLGNLTLRAETAAIIAAFVASAL